MGWWCEGLRARLLLERHERLVDVADVLLALRLQRLEARLGLPVPRDAGDTQGRTARQPAKGRVG